MEDCIVREIKEFNKLSGLFILASSLPHENSKNYTIENMQKRWSNYLMFNVLEYKGMPISFSGVYKYDDNLVRVVDRLFTMPEYRQRFMSKDIIEKIRPAADYFIPYQTKWAKARGFDCFFSIQTSKKRNAVKRLTKLISDDLDYRLLPGLYQTSSNEITGWQNVSATTDNINLPKQSIQ
jgi:hypothetical protein